MESPRYLGTRKLIPVRASAPSAVAATDVLVHTVATGPLAVGNYTKMIVKQFTVMNNEAASVLTIWDGASAVGNIVWGPTTIPATSGAIVDCDLEFLTSLVFQSSVDTGLHMVVTLSDAGEDA